MLISMLPIFLILAVGFLTRKIQLFSDAAITGFKTILIQIALPGALFLAFAQATLKVAYIWVFLLVFLFCVVLYAIGHLLHQFAPRLFPDDYTNGYFTGFEFGMIGIGLFTAIWGMEKLPTIAMIALGHEIFIWFVYVPVLEARKTGGVHISQTIRKFFRTPTVIAILLGVAVNLLNVYPTLVTQTTGQAILRGLNMTSGMVAPLILIVIGNSLSFKKIPLRKSVVLLATRWLVVLGLGYTLLSLMTRFLSLDPFFKIAFYAFILLPPPFILPLFIKPKNKTEIVFFSELLIYYTLLSFIGYTVFMGTMI